MAKTKTRPDPTTRVELLEALLEVSDEAHFLVKNFFDKSKKTRSPKLYQAVIGAEPPAAFNKTGKEVFAALQAFDEPVTLEQWATELPETLGRAKSALGAVKSYARILSLMGLIQEA